MLQDSTLIAINIFVSDHIRRLLRLRRTSRYSTFDTELTENSSGSSGRQTSLSTLESPAEGLDSLSQPHRETSSPLPVVPSPSPTEETLLIDSDTHFWHSPSRASEIMAGLTGDDLSSSPEGPEDTRSGDSDKTLTEDLNSLADTTLTEEIEIKDVSGHPVSPIPNKMSDSTCNLLQESSDHSLEDQEKTEEDIRKKYQNQGAIPKREILKTISKCSDSARSKKEVSESKPSGAMGEFQGHRGNYLPPAIPTVTSLGPRNSDTESESETTIFQRRLTSVSEIVSLTSDVKKHRISLSETSQATEDQESRTKDYKSAGAKVPLRYRVSSAGVRVLTKDLQSSSVFENVGATKGTSRSRYSFSGFRDLTEKPRKRTTSDSETGRAKKDTGKSRDLFSGITGFIAARRIHVISESEPAGATGSPRRVSSDSGSESSELLTSSASETTSPRKSPKLGITPPWRKRRNLQVFISVLEALEKKLLCIISNTEKAATAHSFVETLYTRISLPYDDFASVFNEFITKTVHLRDLVKNLTEFVRNDLVLDAQAAIHKFLESLDQILKDFINVLQLWREFYQILKSAQVTNDQSDIMLKFYIEDADRADKNFKVHATELEDLYKMFVKTSSKYILKKKKKKKCRNSLLLPNTRTSNY